jgi:hypothetical protein
MKREPLSSGPRRRLERRCQVLAVDMPWSPENTKRPTLERSSFLWAHLSIWCFPVELPQRFVVPTPPDMAAALPSPSCRDRSSAPARRKTENRKRLPMLSMRHGLVGTSSASHQRYDKDTRHAVATTKVGWDGEMARLILQPLCPRKVAPSAWCMRTGQRTTETNKIRPFALCGRESTFGLSATASDPRTNYNHH